MPTSLYNPSGCPIVAFYNISRRGPADRGLNFTPTIQFFTTITKAGHAHLLSSAELDSGFFGPGKMDLFLARDNQTLIVAVL